jgi:flagellar FliJ protein
MKKFVFSMQYLLDSHLAKEQAAEYELQTKMAELRRIQTEMERLEESWTAQSDVISNMRGVVNRANHSAYARSIHAVRRQVDTLGKELARATSRVDTCRENLRKQVVARRILENLCERERDEWQEQLQYEEQKQMDEMATVRWSRRGREE